MKDKPFDLQEHVIFGDNSFSAVKSKNTMVTQSNIAIYSSSLVFVWHISEQLKQHTVKNTFKYKPWKFLFCI